VKRERSGYLGEGDGKPSEKRLVCQGGTKEGSKESQGRRKKERSPTYDRTEKERGVECFLDQT